ncbi:MAG: TGS domain-containing protein [Candidatus Nanoarchaeia archaeon]|nr:TGS domain-containing protein [Candidatus Nanoarchaeia archaeon]
MPINAGFEFGKAERKFHEAVTIHEKMEALKEMYRTAPKHKSSEGLLKEIKIKMAKYKELMDRERKQKKGKVAKYSIKKEGAATITLVGTTNSGKSTLLKKLTNSNPLISEYPFTTQDPEIGTMDYKGVKLQIVELPAIVKDFMHSKNGLALMSIIRISDLIVLMYNNEEERKLLYKELEDEQLNILEYKKQNNIKDLMWDHLDMIKVYTKQPGKGKDYPPMALPKGSTLKDIAQKVHKDFIKKFKFARLWGNSVRFQGAQVGLSHILHDEDIVEFHLK